MIRLELGESRDAARLVEALLIAATEVSVQKPYLSKRFTLLADQIGDAIDQSGLPAWTPDPLDPSTKEQQ